MISLKHLKHLQAVAEHRSIRRAAEALHITPPALSRSMGALEDLLGVHLFDRTKGGMEPTEFYLRVQNRCEHILLEVAELKREAQLYRELEDGQLRVGVGRAIRETALRTVLPIFAKEHPKINLVVQEGSLQRLTQGLNQHQFDFVLAGYDSYKGIENFTAEFIQSIAVPVLVRKGHPLAEETGVTLADLFHYPLVAPTELAVSHPVSQQIAKATGVKPKARILCSDYLALRDIVINTDSWTAAPDLQFQVEIQEGLLQRVKMASWSLTIELSAIELIGRSRSPAANRFIELCKELFQKDR